MPLVHITIARGRSKERKQAVLRAVSDAVVAALQVPERNVRVWITEVEPDEYLAGGVLIAERDLTEPAPIDSDME